MATPTTVTVSLESIINDKEFEILLDQIVNIDAASFAVTLGGNPVASLSSGDKKKWTIKLGSSLPIDAPITLKIVDSSGTYTFKTLVFDIDKVSNGIFTDKYVLDSPAGNNLKLRLTIKTAGGPIIIDSEPFVLSAVPDYNKSKIVFKNQYFVQFIGQSIDVTATILDSGGHEVEDGYYDFDFRLVQS